MRATPLRALAVLALACGGAMAPAAASPVTSPAAAPDRGAEAPAGYTNPVLGENAPDPSVIRAQDGYYYLFTTSTYLGDDPEPHVLPIYRSTDMADWEHVGDVFDEAPEWISTAEGAWAPDVHFMNGQYYAYYSTSQAKALPRYGSPAGAYAIGVATAPTPTGPWTDSGPSAGPGYRSGPVVAPRWGWCTDPQDAGCYDWVIDSHVYQGPDGTRYLYEGSYFGGNRLHELAEDGLAVQPGTAVQFGHQIRYEASYLYPHLVGRQRYYYLLASQSNCCEGANTPYSVVANRGNQPYGNLSPDGARSSFTDHEGLPMEYAYGPPYQHAVGEGPAVAPIWWNLAGEGGGFPTLKQNGNGVVGAGHQAVLADLAGQDWMYYHGVEEDDPWSDRAGGTEGGLFRQLHLDRLDWTAEGWPVVDDGNGPTRGGAAPVATPVLGDNFNDRSGPAAAAPVHDRDVRVRWQARDGRWRSGSDPVSGGHLSQTRTDRAASTTSRQTVPHGDQGVRAECDLRATGDGDGRYGCALALGADRGTAGSRVEAAVDVASRSVSLVRYDAAGRAGASQTAALPDALDLGAWNHLVLELAPDPERAGGSLVTATLQNSDRNPLVDLFLPVPGASARTGVGIALASDGAAADFDNVSLVPRRSRVATVAQPPTVGELDAARSDDFGGQLADRWSWLREDPALHGFAPTGALSLTTNGNLDPYQRLNADREDPPELPLTRNVLLQDAPAGDFTVETRLHFDPHTDNLIAGLALYRDDDHHVTNGISWNGVLTQVVSTRSNLTALPPGAECPLPGPVPGANVALEQYSSSACPARSEHTSQEYPAATRCCWDGNGRAEDPSRVSVLLRLDKQGDVITPWFSHDEGATWTRENAWTLEAGDGPLQIALYASANHKAGQPGTEAQAWFDHVRVHDLP